MYESYWKLDHSPFRSGVDPEHFYNSSVHDEALARLEFLVEHRRRMGLVLGPPGCGKTLLLEVFSRQLRRTGARVANVNLLGADGNELLWSLAQQFGGFPATSASPLALWRTVTDLISENRYQHKNTVLLFDGADDATDEALTQVARLAHAHASPDDRMSIVLVANAGRACALGSPLLELVELRVDLEPWELTDTVDYLRRSKHEGRAESLFTPEAEQRLHELAGGVPRRLNQMADLCLLAGAGGDLYQIDTVTVENVFHELDIHEETANR